QREPQQGLGIDLVAGTLRAVGPHVTATGVDQPPRGRPPVEHRAATARQVEHPAGERVLGRVFRPPDAALALAALVHLLLDRRPPLAVELALADLPLDPEGRLVENDPRPTHRALVILVQQPWPLRPQASDRTLGTPAVLLDPEDDRVAAEFGHRVVIPLAG